MYNNQQQSGYYGQGFPSPNYLVQELGGLQQRLLQTQNNPAAQQQINARINEINNILRQMNQGQQQMYPQQQMGYQPQQQMYPQQQMMNQQQPMQQPFRQVGINQGGDVTNTTLNENSRYGNVNRISAYNQQASTIQQTAPVVEEVKPKEPMPGNEYPFLLANGLTVDYKDLGAYFEYEVKGTSNDVYSTKLTTITEECETPELAATDAYSTIMYHCLLNHSTNALFPTMDYKTIVDRKTFEPEDFISAFKKAETLEDLSDVLTKYIKHGSSTSRMVNMLNKLMTKSINDTIEYTAIKKQTIDSFKDDVPSLIRDVITPIQEVSVRKRFLNAVGKCLMQIKTWKFQYAIEDKLVVWKINVPKTILYTSNEHYVNDIRDSLEQSDVVYVTQDSHEELFTILKTSHEAAGKAGVVTLSHVTENGSVKEYETSQTHNELFTVRKVI